MIYYIFMIENLINLLNNNNKENNDNILMNNNIFNLPISYIDDKYIIPKNIITDLELLPNNEGETIYNNLLSPISEDSMNIMPLWSKYYTDNIEFLKDSQSLVKNFKDIELIEDTEINNIHKILKDINEETGFYEKYKYIDVNYFKFLNNYPFFLQGLTIYNLSSPILSLIIPIIMILLPFFILKFQKISISMTTYINVLVKVLKNHVIGRAFTEFNNVGWDRRFFLLISIGFYFINIYQNIISCKTFYINIYKIKSYLLSIKNYIDYSVESINNINKYCKKTYEPFINMNNNINNTLLKFRNEINIIELESISIKQVTKIGNLLKSFYELFQNKIYKESIIYSLNLHGYIENIKNIQVMIKRKEINYCKFKNKSTKFNNSYFGTLVKNKPIKNTYNLDKNIIITGPNAAGKTTLLKATLFNIILSQQIGIGFYKKAYINPYRYIHCYINIPDTSGRDSLFQAEARRCKEILDIISKSEKNDRHFCCFDELYSGTNPTEAIASAYSFLKYISKDKNIDYILTTHYISLCKLLNNDNNIINKQMIIDSDKYTYKLGNNISNIKGGIKVLEQLEYNKEIINSAKNIIDNIVI